LGEEPIPLQNAWSFWHDKFKGPQTAEEYASSLHELCSFDTVQSFWECFNSLPSVTKLQPKSSYHLMKKGVKPIWEDPENQKGGFWTIRISKEDTEAAWKELVLASIGEQFAPVLQDGDDITGVTVSIRGYDNIVQLWNKQADANKTKIWDKVLLVLPNTNIITYFYKPCAEHKSFSTEFVEKVVGSPKN